MKYTPLSFEVNVKEGFCFAVDSLFAALCTLHDQRDARGIRYALVTVLVFMVLAKVSGEDHLRGIAQWVRLRKDKLAEALGLSKPQAPHATTYSRVLRRGLDIEEFEQVTSGFFAGCG
ncbi:MAG: transposase family protein [Anaerolineae bacterium]|nr:transposase family protein [Anaerolineae bacterium]